MEYIDKSLHVHEYRSSRQTGMSLANGHVIILYGMLFELNCHLCKTLRLSVLMVHTTMTSTLPSAI